MFQTSVRQLLNAWRSRCCLRQQLIPIQEDLSLLFPYLPTPTQFLCVPNNSPTRKWTKTHRPVEVAPSSLRPKVLFEGKSHALDRVAVPDGLEHGVGKAQDEQVLRHLLAEVVVDTVNVRLTKVSAEFVGELLDGAAAKIGGEAMHVRRLAGEESLPCQYTHSGDVVLVTTKALRAPAYEDKYTTALPPLVLKSARI